MKTKLLFLLTFAGFSFFSFGQNPTISMTNVQVVEGNAAVFTISLSAVSPLPTIINCATTNQTGGFQDFTPVSTTVTIPAGQLTATVVVLTIEDNLGCESTENFTLSGNVTSGNTNNIDIAGTGTILDNDGSPTVITTDVTVNEGQPAFFTIFLSNPCVVGTVIQLNTVTGTATNLDFEAVQATVVIPAGEMSVNFSIPILNDMISESNETFQLCGIVISSNTLNNVSCGVGTIIDNDGIFAVDDNFTVLSSSASNFSGNVTINDNYNGNPPNTSNTDVVPVNNFPLSIDTNGILTVAPNAPLGPHTIQYSICTTSLPITCSTAIVTVNITTITTISLSAIGTYNDFNNDGFTNVGDVINYQYAVTNTGQQVLSNVQVFYNQSPVMGGPLATLGIGASDSTTFTETYVLTQANINAGIVFGGGYVTSTFNGQQVANDFGMQTPLSISNGIKLNLFFDTNGNGVQNVGEQNYNGGNFTYQLNNGVIHSVTSQNGMFILYESNPANTYNLGCTLSANNNFCNGQYSLATNAYTNVLVANGSGITTYNFPVVAAPCTDLSVSLYQYDAPPRPGFTYMNRIQYTNYGNLTIASGTVTFTRNATVSAVSTFPATTANASGFTYNFTNLLPNQTRYIDVTMQVPVIPTVSLGNLLTNSVSVSVPPNDFNAANNSDGLTQVIVGSYDPNDKTESHGNKILHSSFTSNDYLTYKIQFENTGTFEAVNIRVNDVLDAKLNPSTLRMVSVSHPYVLDRVGNTLNWKFEGVNLPPSVANTQIGHGFIIFQVKPTAGYAVGDIISNIASIFFDFNPPIVTEPCVTQFVSTLANTDFDANSISVYPNPAQNKLTITTTSSIDSIEVISILGQTVLLQTAQDKNATIDLSALDKGVYLVKVASKDKAKTFKIIKE